MSEPIKPLIQIDDVIREMTDEELAAYEALQAETSPIPTASDNPV